MLRRECKVQSGNHIRANGVALNKSQKHTGKTFLFTHTKKKHTQNAGHRLKQQKTLTHRDVAKKTLYCSIKLSTVGIWQSIFLCLPFLFSFHTVLDSKYDI